MPYQLVVFSVLVLHIVAHFVLTVQKEWTCSLHLEAVVAVATAFILMPNTIAKADTVTHCRCYHSHLLKVN